MAKQILGGIGRIAYAPFKAGTFAKPTDIEYAKKIEMELKYESEELWGGSRVIYRNNSFGGGEGELAVHAMSKEEQSLIFGQKQVKGGLVVKDTDIAPEGAFIFERAHRNSNHKRLYVVYVCQCKPCPISAETVEEGKTPEALDEIEFSIGSMADGLIMYYIDTNAEDAEAEQVTNWFTEVQMPVDKTPAAKVVKEK